MIVLFHIELHLKYYQSSLNSSYKANSVSNNKSNMLGMKVTSVHIGKYVAVEYNAISNKSKYEPKETGM